MVYLVLIDRLKACQVAAFFFLQIFDYNGSPVQFEVVNGHVMANANSMLKAHNEGEKLKYRKDKTYKMRFKSSPVDITKTKTWVEFAETVCEDANLRFEDVQSVRNGDNGGTWIHQELVIEFARRLNPRFALWCNRKIAELLKGGQTSITPAANIENMESIILQKRQNELKREKIYSRFVCKMCTNKKALTRINS